MTKAVCFNCGSMKFGAFVECKECHLRPISDDDLAMSLAMTDHYFDENTMKVMAADIKRGEKLKLDDASKANILKSFEDSRAMITNLGSSGGFPLKSQERSKKPFWKLW